MKSNKLSKKLLDCFRKLNNRNSLKFLDDCDSGTHQNLLDLCSLLRKACEKEYGLKSNYSKKKVGKIIYSLFPNPTDNQISMLDKLNKYFKKTDDINVHMYDLEGLFPGKSYDRYLAEMDYDD